MEWSREMEALVEERCGRLTARLLLYSLVGGTIAAGLTASGVAVLWVYRNVTPLFGGITVNASVMANALISVAITLSMVGLVLRLMHLRERRLIRITDEFFKAAVFTRIQHIEESAPSLASVRSAVDGLHARLTGVEPMTNGVEGQEMQNYTLQKLLDAPSIQPVGRAPDTQP